MRVSRFLSVLCVTAGAFGFLCVAAETKPSAASKPALRLDRFEKTIEGFEKKDKQSPPAQGGVLFIGSSTFARWTELEQDFKEFHAINRGFGGSTIPEVLHYADRVIFPYRPSAIVLYAGTNDLAKDRSPEAVLGDFKALVAKIRKELPDVPIYFIAINPAPARAKFIDAYRKADDLIQAEIEKTPGLYFIDPRPLMKDTQGQHRMELYVADKLHMTRQGYELWIPLIKKALRDKCSVTAPVPQATTKAAA